MPSSRQAVPLEQLREAARQYSEAVTQRVAAREIGMSPGGFHAFLQGTAPHAGTVRKLTAWYFRSLEARGGVLTAETARAAISLLAGHLPGTHQSRLAQRIVEAIRSEGADAGIPDPSWLAEMLVAEK
jgi:hypothetical protein